MGDPLDESVSNGTAAEVIDEDAPETGPAPPESADTAVDGGAIELGQESIESVDGYEPPTMSSGDGEFGPESAGVDDEPFAECFASNEHSEPHLVSADQRDLGRHHPSGEDECGVHDRSVPDVAR